MGRLADVVRDGVHLPEQKLRQILSLDEEFSNLETENKSLKAKNLRLKAQVNPLQREVDSLKQRINKQDDRSLDERSENILVTIANYPGKPRNLICEHFKLAEGLCAHHYDILREKKFIIQLTIGRSIGDHTYTATSAGRQYLADHGLLK